MTGMNTPTYSEAEVKELLTQATDAILREVEKSDKEFDGAAVDMFSKAAEQMRLKYESALRLALIALESKQVSHQQNMDAIKAVREALAPTPASLPAPPVRR